jgi:protease II
MSEIDTLLASLAGNFKTAADASTPAPVATPAGTPASSAADELRKKAHELLNVNAAPDLQELYKMAATMHAADNAALAAEAEVLGSAMFDGFVKRSNAWAADQQALAQQEAAVQANAAHLQKVASDAAAYTQQILTPQPQPDQEAVKYAHYAEALLLGSYNWGYSGAAQVLGG